MVTCARNSLATVAGFRIGWIFAGGVAIKSSGPAASDLVRAKGQVQENGLARGRAQASDRPVAGPAPDNGLRRENLAPSGPQAGSVPRNGPQADGVVMHWAI